MKRMIIGGALMLLATTTLKAQEQPLSFGVQAGGSLSWLQGLDKKPFTGDQKGEVSGRRFVSGGLTGGYAFSEYVGIGVEVLYAGLGAENSKVEKASDENDKKTDKDTFRIHSHNLLLPAFVRFFPMGYDPEEGILGIHLGVQGCLPLDVTVHKGDSKDEQFKKEYTNAFTVGALAGMSYEFPEIALTLEGRYNYDFMPLFKDEDAAKKYKELIGLKDEKLNSHFVTASVGYNFARLLDS